MERKENDREDRDERVETEICITTALTMGLSENSESEKVLGI